MDMMSMVSSLLAMQAGGVQSQIGTAILKSNADTEKATVLTLLGAAQQSSQANLAAGVGGNIDVTA
jgi:putative motility protein YjfB-like